jgi:pSer/pThr/pTyr-binding forkhead associated (FHA) protein/uncharacterized protein YraI
MKYGSLNIRFPDGKTSDFSIDQPSLLVGRAQGNDLILDHSSVSRRHARFTIESGQLYVEDLGSANGTFIDDQKLDADSPTRVIEKQVIRFGDISLVFSAPPPLETSDTVRPVTYEAMGGQKESVIVSPKPATAAPDRPVSLSMIGPADPVIPGNVATATITILNRGTVVDELTLRITGVPLEWIKFSKDRVALLPNAKEQVTILFSPPRRADALAGDYRFTLTVFSKEYHTGENALGILQVLPFNDSGIELSPIRSRRDFQLILHNRGNIPASFRLQGIDEEAALLFKFGQPAVTLQAGQSGSIPLQVRPKVGKRIGSRETRLFTVVAAPVSGGNDVKISGQLSYKPPIPIWIIPIVLLLGLCAVLGGSAAYATLCPTYSPNLPFCPKTARPEIQTFVAQPNEVQPGGNVVIGWNVTHADQVQLTSPVQSTLKNTDTMTYTVNQTTTFTIHASNFAGSVEKSIIVAVKSPNPVIQTFNSSPKAIIMGQTKQIVLNWAVNGASSVNIVGVPQQNLPPTGSITIPAPSDPTTFTLVVNGNNGAVSQELTLSVVSAGCVVNNNVKMLAGPDPSQPVLVKLTNGTQVLPTGRNQTATWLRVQANNKEGWVPADIVSCMSGSPLDYPAVDPGQIPTPIPSSTPTATRTPTSTATTTMTPTITQTPTITSTGQFIIPIHKFPFFFLFSTPTP